MYRSHRSGWPEANSCLGQTLREQKDGNDAIVFWASLPMIERYEGSHRKSELLEECALSLFGRLLADRNQNSRALKSTLRSAWKLGSDLRIVDVGKNIFQFKFNSKYQMEWVERNGLWNFDNNLLLMCRWRKRLSITNISFTHSPFWVQVWGLPFENMSEEVGRDLGNRLGKYIETDKRS